MPQEMKTKAHKVQKGQTYQRNEDRHLVVVDLVDKQNQRVFYKNKSGATVSVKLSLFGTKSKKGFTLVSEAPKRAATKEPPANDDTPEPQAVAPTLGPNES